jgi:hypothetical protein
MKFKLFTIAGTLFLLVPVLLFILWIIAANRGSNQTESVSIFLSFLPNSIQNVKTITLIEILFCAFALTATAISRKIKGRLWNILNLTVLILSSILLFLNIFSLM